MLLRQILQKLRAIRVKARGAQVSLMLRASGCGVGARLTVGRGVTIIVHPGARLEIEDNVYIGDFSRIEVMSNAVLRIARECKFSGHNWLVAGESIDIGANCLFGEFAGVRDHQHGFNHGELISRQPLVSKAVVIGDDTWICRGATVLMGAGLAAGSVVGAHAVMKASTDKGDIVGGVPARKIGTRGARHDIG